MSTFAEGVTSSASSAASVEATNDRSTHWSPFARLVFRSVAVYMVLYVASTQMLSSLMPRVGFAPLDSTNGVQRTAATWVATHVLGFNPPISYRNSGSGDRAYDRAFCLLLLIVAGAATAVWSALDRKRPNYVNLQNWFRLFLRFALGATLASYGMAKVVPVQMPYPNLTTLLEPYGNLTHPRSRLWNCAGAAGCDENVGIRESRVSSREDLCPQLESLAGR